MKFDKLSPNLLSGIVSILFGIFIYPFSTVETLLKDSYKVIPQITGNF